MPRSKFPVELFPCTINNPTLLAIPPRLRRALAWLIVTVFCSLYYVLPGLVLASVALAYRGYRRAALGIAALLVAGACAPVRERASVRRFCQIFYEIFGVRHNLSDARIRVVVEDCVLRGDRFILGMHPHGVVPIQALLWAAYADQYLRTPEHGTVYGFGGMATVILYLPGLRTLLGWLTGTPATYANLRHNLTSSTDKGETFQGRHPGRNLYMLPGGVAEIFSASPGTHTVVWKPRRGLCRLALETGARLVPMYIFGGNDFFQQMLTSDSWLSRTSRSLGLSLTLFWGWRWWAPVVPLVPRHGVSIVLSEPMPSRRAKAADGKPTEEEIDAVHAEYEATLRALFDEYKGACGYPDGELVVR
jgi:hypothetical protein